MKIITTKSIAETQTFAKKWLSSLASKIDEATIVGLYGNLGSGKTTFTQAVARELGIKEVVTSPTFVILKIYDTTYHIFKRLIHIDAYRLRNGRELQDLNFEELIENKNNFIIIEWPENVREILPDNHIRIHCQFVGENNRRFEVQ